MYFPLRPRHRLHEPAHGYVLRLVETNGYAWRGCKLLEVGANLSSLANGTDLEFACRYGQADPEQLAFSTPQPDGPSRNRLCGQILHRSQLVFGRKRFCAACWSEERAGPDGNGPNSPYLRCWWSVAAVTSCPVHRTRLTDRCPVCDRGLTFESGGLTTCRCGIDLTRLPIRCVEHGSIAVDAYIVGRLTGAPAAEVPVLDDMSLGEAVVLVQRLGCIAWPGTSIRLTDVPLKDRERLLAAGFEMCILGAPAVEAALGQYLDATGRTDAFKSALGSFYAWVRELDPSPSRAWLMDRLATVFRAKHFRWDGRRGDGSHLPTAERSTLREAGKLLELSHTPARRVLEASDLLAAAGARCVRHTVNRNRVIELRRRLDRLVDVRTASSRLGVDAKSVLALATSGILPHSILGRHAFGNATMFDQADIDALLTKLTASAIHVDVLPPGGKRLPDASRTCGMVALCRQILDGSIVPCAAISGEPGLKAIVVARDVYRSIDSQTARSHLTAGAARRRLGLREATMTGLLACGHLRAEAGPRARKLVSCCEIDAFEKRYVTSSELARRWGTNTTIVLATMRAAGHDPLIEFDRTGRTEVRFFDRGAAAGMRSIPRVARDRARSAIRIEKLPE